MSRARLGIFVLAAGLIALGGCASGQIQIWSNSDSDDSTMYTQRNPHYVHVGEAVQFRAPVQPNTVSYVLMDLQGQLYMLEKVGEGDYAFGWTFDESWRDKRVYLEAQAYRQAGRPDYIVESGRARKLAASDDPADALLSSVRMTVQCYQSRVVVRVWSPGGMEPDWSKAVLEVYGPNEKVSKVRLGRPGTDGFVALGKDSGGAYTVIYEPTIEQIHKTGKTKAVFVYPNPSGEGELRQEVWFETP